MTTSNSWRYFGRTAGGPSVFEICRFPDNGRVLDEQDWSQYPEWLQPDGTWAFYPDDSTICNELVFGEFDECRNEITREQVDELCFQWQSEGWRGRRRTDP